MGLFGKKPLPLNEETAQLLFRTIKDRRDEDDRLRQFARKHLLTPEHFLLENEEGESALNWMTRHRQLDQANEALGYSGEKLRLEHLLKKDGMGETALFWAAGRSVNQLQAVLETSGELLPLEGFLVKGRSGYTPLEQAAFGAELDKLFIPSLWTCRVGDMEKLWEHVPQEFRIQVDYEAVRNQTILEGIRQAPKWDAAAYAGAQRTSESVRETLSPAKTR